MIDWRAPAYEVGQHDRSTRQRHSAISRFHVRKRCLRSHPTVGVAVRVIVLNHCSSMAVIQSPLSMYRVEGYPRLAGLLSAKPQTAIFRRFGELNVRNLLYLQAELTVMEHELHEITLEDWKSDNPRDRAYCTQWTCLDESIGDDRNGHQWKQCLKIREKLNEYSSTLTFLQFENL